MSTTEVCNVSGRAGEAITSSTDGSLSCTCHVAADYDNDDLIIGIVAFLID